MSGQSRGFKIVIPYKLVDKFALTGTSEYLYSGHFPDDLSVSTLKGG